MRRDCATARPVKPTVFTDLRSGRGLEELTALLVDGAMLTVSHA
jgi:urease accessory protein